MFAKVKTCASLGLNCELVEVEADQIRTDQPFFIIVGLPDASVQEAKERVKLAIKNSGFEFPRFKTIVNLAPADLRKEGPSFDLAIALAILQTTNQIQINVDDTLFIGELALNGEIRPTNGVLPAVLFAKEHGFKNIFVPEANQHEATLISDINIFPVTSLAQVLNHLTNNQLINPAQKFDLSSIQNNYEVDFSHIQGQEQAKRALEIAAAGRHNILMSGPPGSGKTLLAKAFPSIMPEMDEDEILEVTKIYSVAGLLAKDEPIVRRRPFRSPHHTSSGIALVGGGKLPRPGEISLAHRGILFLDELPEFPRQVLENLRQPLEDGTISISRAQGSLSFPARFTLIASQNPCPCGYYRDPEKKCLCSTSQIIKYSKKISGPLLDRIDLHIEVPRINFEKLQTNQNNESSAKVQERVKQAHRIQQQRFANLPIKYNSEMHSPEVKNFCHLDPTSIDLLRVAVNQFHLSARAYHRILKLARTIADLAGEEEIKNQHLAEALQYRPQNNEI